MIRRDQDGRFLIISMRDHCAVSGQLAELWGNDQFSPPRPARSTILAARLHDSGWGIHDERPTLDSEGRPLDVFQTPARIAVPVWTAAVENVAAQDPYAGLLVSLHVLALSNFALGRAASPEVVFQLNRFQQVQVERQQELRASIGLRTDRALTLGLAAPGESEAEDRLRYNYNVLRTLDQISLAACCEPVPFAQVAGLSRRPGDPTECPLAIHRSGASDVQLSPWPFSRPEILLTIPYRALNVRPFADEQQYQAALGAADEQSLAVRLFPAP